MAKKEQNQNAKADEVTLPASASVPGDNAIPTGSDEQGGEEKGGESAEIPPASPAAPETLSDSEAPKAPEAENKDENKSVDSRRLKISALVSGQLFAAGMKASEIPPESVSLIPSKYFEGEQ